MSRPFKQLRDRMHENEMGQVELARTLDIGTATLGNKINSRSSWTLDEAYEALKALGLPESEIYTYFPPRVKEKPTTLAKGHSPARRWVV